MKTTYTITGTLVLVALILGGLGTPAGAMPVPAVALGHAHCSHVVLAPTGAAVVNPTTTEVLVSAIVAHESDCYSGTYSLSVTDCPGRGDSHSAAQTQVFPLVASISKQAWEDVIAIQCTIAMSVPVFPGDEGSVVVAHADIWIIQDSP